GGVPLQSLRGEAIRPQGAAQPLPRRCRGDCRGRGGVAGIAAVEEAVTMWARVKSWIAWIGAALLPLIGIGLVGRRRVERPVGREVDKALEDTRAAAGRAGDVIAEETAAREERLKKAKALSDRLRRLPVILLLALGLTLAAPVAAQQIPGDY